MRTKRGTSTTAVHAGAQKDALCGSVNTAIYQTSTFFFPTEDPRTWEGEVPDGTYIYTRYSNPTIRDAEEKVAALEGGERGLVFSSGMASISAALLSLLSKGDRVVSVEDIYGGTYNLMVNHLSRLGVETAFAPTTDTSALVEAIRPGTKVVYLEAPTNPLLKLIEVPEVVEAAHAVGAKVLMDSTFATPVNQRPLEWGVDIVLHSCTKYLNGHSDLIAGAAVGSAQDLEELYKRRIAFGGVLDPMGAFLLSRGIKTLDVRMERHNRNGLEVARYLEGHELVDKVHYPGLDSHPQHDLARRTMRGFGGMVSFEVKGGRKAAEAMMRKLGLIKMATSLGGVDSLVSMPINSSHVAVPRKDRLRLGIRDNLVRLSVGIEDVFDLTADLDQALRASQP